MLDFWYMWIEFREHITKNQEGTWVSMGGLVVRNVSFKEQSGWRPTTRRGTIFKR